MKAILLLISAVTTGTALGADLPDAVTDRDYYYGGEPAADKVELGRMLFFDKILSGNRNISCATCHHPTLASGDGVSLPLGEGALGLGSARQPGADAAASVAGRVPRNSPGLFNLGAIEFERLFHDGRVEADPNNYYDGGFITPAKWKLPRGLDNPLAAQAMFPVTSPVEMAGNKGENEIADAISLNNAAGKGGVWELLAERLQNIPEYVELFRRAYPNNVESAEGITFVLAANAIAAFESEAFRADNSPFDRYLRGDGTSLTREQLRGMDLFFGDAGCSDCHGGKFQTDHNFHAIAMPQIGPGKADGRDASYWNETGISAVLEDYGRGRVTVRPQDNYKFRTPSLRNVATTGPWGHAGAYTTLEAVVRHHLDPVNALHNYDTAQAKMPQLGQIVELSASGSKLSQGFMAESRRQEFEKQDTWVQQNDALRHRIADANELAPIDIGDRDVDALLAFLESLTDPVATRLDAIIPAAVPSGLPIAD